MKYSILYSVLLVAVIMLSVTVAYAQDPDPAELETELDSELESLTLEPEDTLNGTAIDDFDTLEEFMVTKELEGKIKEAGDGYVVVMLEGGQELRLVVDAETLIYINDEMSELGDIQADDEIFAYYIEENGALKCDWVEITR